MKLPLNETESEPELPVLVRRRMAKKSMIARDVKRKKLVERYAAKRIALLKDFHSAKDPMQRLEIHRKI